MVRQSGRQTQEPKPRELIFSITDGELKPVTKKTNSLGVSKTPCHSCKAKARSCDRQRPKCGSCEYCKNVGNSNNELIEELTKGLKINQDCGYTLDVRWKRPNLGRRQLGSSDSKRCNSAIPRSVSPFSAHTSDVPEALYYHQHCLADIAAATAGCRLNPLRSVMPLVAESVPLQHAIILLAATHRQNPAVELMRLKSKALKTFANALPHLDDTLKLAVILVLLFADFVYNGQSSWFTHLSAVAKIMENMHGAKSKGLLLQEDSQRAIIFQLYWFDTMNALLVAQPPILPAHLLEDALRISGEHIKSELDSITYDTYGLSERMFLLLSHIVREHDHSIEEIQGLKVPGVDSFIDDGWMRKDAEERVHTEEVWKHATVTYLMTRRPPYRWPRHIFELHAQQVFEHASCLAPSSAKRRCILLPLLFAGSCTSYSERMDFMRRYCADSFRDTNFGVFQMGLGILQQVWTLRSREEEERKAVGGRAYSCWRNVTAIADNPSIAAT